MNKLIETAKELDRILESGIEILPNSPIHEKLKQALNITCVATHFSANEIENVMRKVEKVIISPFFKQILQRATGDSYDSADDKAFFDKYTGKVANVYVGVSVSLPDPALKLAGKMAIAAETVINSKITTVSVAIAMLEDALNEYNNEIFSRQ